MTDGAFPPPPPGGSGSTPPPPPPPPGLTPPPGYTPYQTGAAPAGRSISRVGGVGKASIILVGIAGVLGLVSAFLTLPVVDKAKAFLDGTGSSDDFTDAYAPLQLFQALQSVLGLAAGIVTMIWIFRMSNNVRAFGRTTTWAPVFAIFGWVLPPLLYVIPLLMLLELWKASNPESPAGTDTWKSTPNNPLLFVWFLVYSLVPLIVTAVTIGPLFSAMFNASGDETIAAETVEASGSTVLVTGVASLIGAIVWIVFAKQMTARHVALTGER